jgi:hypothetical protein
MKFRIMQYLPFPDRSVRVGVDISLRFSKANSDLEVSYVETTSHNLVVPTTAIFYGGACFKV